MEQGAYSPTDLRNQPHRIACSLACTESGMAGNTDASTLLPTKAGRCACGFSGLQINILAVLKAHQDVISYWQIAYTVQNRFGQTTTEGAVRGALERLYRQGFLIRQRARRAHLKGNRYAFNAVPCPHIQPYTAFTQSGADCSMHTFVESGKIGTPSILEEIDRKTLSISSEETEEKKSLRLLEALTEEDMAFHWPTLAHQGFGTNQIRQILSRLAQVNAGVKQIMQGLTYAEWELAANRMRNKSGDPIDRPVNWVFKILATQGYYPRPEGYRSPQEQAELDAAEELKQHTAAFEARQAAEAEAWIARLTPDERSAILGPQTNRMHMPDEVVLRRHFRSEIWPKIQREEKI